MAPHKPRKDYASTGPDDGRPSAQRWLGLHRDIYGRPVPALSLTADDGRPVMRTGLCAEIERRLDRGAVHHLSVEPLRPQMAAGQCCCEQCCCRSPFPRHTMGGWR